MEFFLATHQQTREQCILEGFEETRNLDTRLWHIVPFSPIKEREPLVILEIKKRGKKGFIKKEVYSFRELEGIYV